VHSRAEPARGLDRQGGCGGRPPVDRRRRAQKSGQRRGVDRPAGADTRHVPIIEGSCASDAAVWGRPHARAQASARAFAAAVNGPPFADSTTSSRPRPRSSSRTVSRIRLRTRR